jgi:hypothetical protein
MAVASQSFPRDMLGFDRIRVGAFIYLTREGTDRETSRQIVRLGDEGWHLVDVETFCREGTTVKTVYYFKRGR